MTITFEVFGTPKGQPRARAFAQRFGNKFSARMYDPGTADEWKEAVYFGLRTALRTFGDQPSLGAFKVSMRFAMPRPKAHFGKRGLKSNAPRHPVGKPDIDNLTKLVLDVITKDGRVWRDDSQVVTVLAYKGYVSEGDKPHAWISIASDEEPLEAGKDLREEAPEV
jgi:Holliday junction resolvase RusA-like endonuclease